MKTINGRFSNDYSPTLPGSREENAAINARREMMNTFDSYHTRRTRRQGNKAALLALENARKRT